MLTCTNCSHENLPDAKFCQNCGQPLLRACPNCSTLNELEAKFCRNCGHPFEADENSEDAPRLKTLQDAAPKGLQEKVKAARSDIRGARKPVTILFADIVGSTSIAEKLDPEEWKEIISGAHRRVSEAIYRYEGTIAQLLGDGVLAFFGAPVTHEDDPVRALHAALEIQDAVADYERELKNLVDGFQMRIGVNSGTVVIGNIGSDMHMEYLAIGDAVNLAARLQSAADPGKILVAQTTVRLVKGAFDLHDLGEIEIKGKSDPIEVSEVIQAKASPESGRGIEGLHSPLVGREAELTTLQSVLDSLRKGQGQIVTILGEAGIGKTRLLEELKSVIDEDSSRELPPMVWLEGRALSYGSSLSYWLVTQLLLNDIHLSEGDPEARIKVALQKRVKSLFADDEPDVLPFLLHLLGVRLEDNQRKKIDRLDGETLKHQTLLAVSEYFRRRAEDRPAVIVFEDLHWADPSSLEALEHLLALTERVPLMVLIVMRIDRDHASWQLKLTAASEYAHRYTEIDLKRLSSIQSDELVDHLLEIAELPTRIRGSIMARSDGNPFYLEEIIRNFIDQGVIVQEDGSWRATEEITDLTIPETLQGVLLARIDRLEEDVRSTLQLASVIGKSFMYRLLEAIAEAEKHLDTHLTQLQRADLVREKARWPELEYIFKHSLTQEAAYESLLLERRKTFHFRVAEAMEHLFADRQEEFYGLLAHHFEAAGTKEKALEYLIKMGDKSRLEDAHKEAITFYERALHLLADEVYDPRVPKLWLKLGLIYQTSFDYADAHKAYDMAFTLTQKSKAQSKPEITAEQADQLNVFRIATSHALSVIDPGRLYWGHEAFVAHQLFEGLAEIDSEANVLPLIASSWEVLDEGKRYVFHLRDDVIWTDETPVTAMDFEWAWKRNLRPELEAPAARLLDDVVGAREYRLGKNPDPNSVGVRALDPTTLEVRLSTSVAYFIYVVTQSITFPLPRHLIERVGENWWLPEHFQSNGPFKLTDFSENGGKLVKNRAYFGDFPGNLDAIEWRLEKEEERRLSGYLDGNSEFTVSIYQRNLADKVSPDEIFDSSGGFNVHFLMLNPVQPPLDDIRVRKAIVHALDPRKIMEAINGPGTPAATGGLIPYRMVGHSPDIALGHNPSTARRYLEEAGFPSAADFPALDYFPLTDSEISRLGAEELSRQLNQVLGIQIKIQDPTPLESTGKHQRHLNALGWMADFPDPDNVLHQSVVYSGLRKLGWRNQVYDALVETAAQTTDRAKRLAMYRQADNILIREDVVILPLHYSENTDFDLLKPYVKGMALGSVSHARMRNVSFEK